MNYQHQESFHEFEIAYKELLTWCRTRGFAGYDPFDALNSRLFQHTPLAKSHAARLVWTQLIKRAPLNPRQLIAVPPQQNAKGTALFALAALASHRRSPSEETELHARTLLQYLLEMRIQGFSGAAWGYNFAWQSRNFFAPVGSPTIVPTAFAARALLEGALTFKDEEYLRVARSVCDFILQDLPLHHEPNGAICFSYSPGSNTQIFNASLLAAETLAQVGTATGEQDLCDFAGRATDYVVDRQRPDGSWSYGTESTQSWIDNFHTAFVLYSLRKIHSACGLEATSTQAMERGYAFWRETFFLADGWPKYYHDSLYPADAHAAASGMITLLEFQDSDPAALGLAERVGRWTIEHLRSPGGFFYYQRKRFFTVKTPFMRWSEAWMLYALARLLEEKARHTA